MKEAIRRSQDENFYAVCLKETGKVIGNLYLAQNEFQTWELGFVFNRHYQDQGFATESTKALLTCLFKSNQAHRVMAMCKIDNERSWLLQRLGLRREVTVS